MPIDTSIYNNVRPFMMGDPYESAGKALALRDAQRKFTQEEDLTAAGREAGGDPAKMASILLQKGQYAPALKLQSLAAEQKKTEAATLEADQKRFTTLLPVLRDALARVNDDAGLAQYKSSIANIAATFTTPQFKQIMAAGLQEIPDQFSPQWKQQQLVDAEEVLKRTRPNVSLQDTGGQLVPVQTNPNAEGGFGPVAGAKPIPKTAPPAAPTELARLQGERDAIAQQNPNDPRLAQYDRVITNYKAGRGDTNVQVNTGPMTPGKTAGNKVDEDLLGVTRNLMQLDNIAAQFKPEFQRFQDKAGYAALKVKDSTVGLTNKEKRDLAEYSSYRRNAFNTLNEYIKSVTGAAMSEAEANRIRKSMPDPGDGIFGGDSPTEFKAKLDDTLRQTKMAVARLSYIKRNGMSLEDGNGNPVVPLERMPVLINQRGQEIEKELRAAQPKADAKAIQKAVRRQLSVEFGLSSD